MKTKLLRAISALVGTAIGAGILGIPYTVMHAGILVGLGYLLLLTGVVLILNLMYGEAVLRTKGDHQLAGYAKIYFGLGGEILATVASLVGIYGALLAYVIKGGEFLAFIFNTNPVVSSVFFAGVCSLLVLIGLKILSEVEIFLTIGILGLVVLLIAVASSQISPVNFSPLAVFEIPFLLLPYGVVLFALHSASVIPEVEEILRLEHRLLKRAIIFGTLIPAVVYLLFALTVLGICGRFTSDDAITGLEAFLPVWVSVGGALLAVFAMGTSFLTLGYVLKETYYRDWGINRYTAWAFSCLIPLALFFFVSKDFIAVLGTTGAITGSLTGIIVLGIYSRARREGTRKPEYSLAVPPAVRILLGFVLFLGGLLTVVL